MTLVCLAPATASPAADPLGIFRQQGDGTYVYQSDVYRVAFNRDGVMSSLQVKGHEFLRPVQGDVGGAGFFLNGKRMTMPTVEPESTTEAMIGDGTCGIFLAMTPDRLDLDVGQEEPAGKVEYVFFPAEGIKMTPVENPVFLGHRNEAWQIIGKSATRWTAPDGTFIELQYDTQLQNSYNGAPAMPVVDPYKTRICGEIRFPASGWSGARATVDWEADVADHNYRAGQPMVLSGNVTVAKNTGAMPLDVTVSLEDYNTLRVVHTETQHVTCTGAAPAPFTTTLRGDAPGPWRVIVLAVENDHVVGARSGVLVYDLDHYLPPLNRPADFWQFWEQALATQRSLPLDAVLLKDETVSTADTTVYTVYITGYQGRRLRGGYREPTAPGHYPALISAALPTGAVGAPTPADAGCCAVIGGLDGMATYRTGLGNRFTSNLFYNYVDQMRWVDFMATREKADLDRSIYYAGSRSGPIGIALLALDPRVKMYIANVPTNNRWDWQVEYPGAGGWGPWAHDRLPGQSLADFQHELSYFNADNFAERVTQPVLIGCGLLDGLAQVSGTLACYARLASPQKKICLRAWWGHMDANQDWYDTGAQWRKELFAAEK
jgi:cephalosporin-C deacetylase